MHREYRNRILLQRTGTFRQLSVVRNQRSESEVRIITDLLSGLRRRERAVQRGLCSHHIRGPWYYDWGKEKGVDQRSTGSACRPEPWGDPLGRTHPVNLPTNHTTGFPLKDGQAPRHRMPATAPSACRALAVFGLTPRAGAFASSAHEGCCAVVLGLSDGRPFQSWLAWT